MALKELSSAFYTVNRTRTKLAKHNLHNNTKNKNKGITGPHNTRNTNEKVSLTYTRPQVDSTELLGRPCPQVHYMGQQTCIPIPSILSSHGGTQK